MINKKTNREFIKKEEEFDQRMVDVARVTRVMAGGKRMKFRVCLAIGDRKGRVGVGVAKGADVTMAINKALAKAKKKIIKLQLFNDTIPHPIWIKFKAAKIILKPAKRGTGVKAGGPVRILCELAGIPNITAKILGSNNKINIATATMLAFNNFETAKGKQKKDKEVVAEEGKQSIQKTDEKVVKPQEAGKKSLKDRLKNIITKKEGK
jgi:small subunit ribosomal protein S5